MPWTWHQDPPPTDDLLLRKAVDGYLHWALASRMSHFGTPIDAKKPGWLTLLVRWKADRPAEPLDHAIWMDPVNRLRKRYPGYGRVLINTLPTGFAHAQRHAVLSVKLMPAAGRTFGDEARDLVADLLDHEAECLEFTQPLVDRLDEDGSSKPAGSGDTASGDEGGTDQLQPCAKVFGVIDDLIPWAHDHYAPRIHAVWLQGTDSNGHISEVCPRPGHPDRHAPAKQIRRETRAFLDGDLALPQRQWRRPCDSLEDREALEQLSVRLGFPQLRRRYSHGAHVTDLLLHADPPAQRLSNADSRLPARAAAGPGDVRLVGVQLPWQTVRDTSGRWLGGHVLAGLIYILDQARRLGPVEGQTQQVVVNISYGYTTGPHDGSSLLEEAIDALCASIPQQPGLDMALSVCLPAGNSFSAQAHAAFTLAPGASRSLVWRVLPDGHRPTFLECWIDDLEDDDRWPELVIDLPGQPAGQQTLGGHAGAWRFATQAGGDPVGWLRLARAANGRVQMLLAVAPTDVANRPEAAVAAPHGDWRITWHNRSARQITVRADAARSTAHLYSRRDGTLSYLVDPDYDPDRYLRAAEDDAAAAVQRRGTLNGMATGRATLVATGYQVRAPEGARGDVAHPAYASAGPAVAAAGGAVPPGKSPTVGCPTDESRALPGILAGGNRGAVRVRLVGTSTASPQLARAIMDGHPPDVGPQGQPRPGKRPVGLSRDPGLTGYLKQKY